MRYGLLGLGLLAAIAVLPGLIGRLRGSVAWMGVTKLKRRLDRGDPVTVVDVRGPEEFTGAEAERFPGASQGRERGSDLNEIG